MLRFRFRGKTGRLLAIYDCIKERTPVDKINGIPFDQIMQVALIPMAYTKGTEFKAAYRPPVETVMHFNSW